MANKALEYRDGAVTLKGYLADDARPGARPGVVLFPEATGVGAHVMEKARPEAAAGARGLAGERGRSGAPLSAVVSFHGGLEAPKPEDARTIRAKVLVCHGAGDPLIPPEQVAAFEAQMRETKVDWQGCVYGG